MEEISKLFWKKNYWIRDSEEKDNFFTAEYCERCHNKLNERITSWFTNATICTDCSEKEDKLKKNMRKHGLNPDFYEGCGRIMYSKIRQLYGEE